MNANKKFEHVAVLMGGWSEERDVSLNSGQACSNALRELGYKVSEIDVTPDLSSALKELKPDVVFNALHGKYGEDGLVQGILEIMNIPYTHSGVLASALAMDKPMAKKIYVNCGIPVAESMVIERTELPTREFIPAPYVVKPISEGSSVGVYILQKGVVHTDPVVANIAADSKLGEFIMLERYAPGIELTCAVMGNTALAVTEIKSATKFYDYEAKYAPGGSEHILPAKIPDKIYRLVQKYSLDAHLALGCKGVSRSDFRYDDRGGEKGELVILETNTQPGMTETSLVPEQAIYAGHSFSELVEWIINDASCQR